MEGTILLGPYLIPITLIFILVGLIIYRHKKGGYFKSSYLNYGEASTLGDREIQENASDVIKTAWGILAVVADGTGKGQAGRTAALVTVRTIIDLFKAENVTRNIYYFFNKALQLSNREVLDHLRGNKGRAAVATVLINKNNLYYASVGNVKIAVFRNNELITINEGHTLKTTAAKGFERGLLTREQALAIGQSDRQTNYIGRDGFKNGEIGTDPIKLEVDDIVLLMSAGIYKYISWAELENVLPKSISCQYLAEQIIGKFNAKSQIGKQSCRLIVLRYKGS